MDKLRLKYNDKVTIFTLDIDSEKEFCKRIGISAVPTLLFVGDADPAKPAILTQGHVTCKMLSDVLDNKIQYAGADVCKPIRLF